MDYRQEGEPVADDGLVQEFANAWLRAAPDPTKPPELAENWRHSVRSFGRAGLVLDDLTYAIDTTVDRKLPPSDWFRYFAGVCWTLIREHKGLTRGAK